MLGFRSTRARRIALSAAVVVGLGSAFGAGYAVAAQVHMNNALAALQTAKSELDAADRDKGGHREKAEGFVERAIEQVHMGIAAAS